MSRSSKAAKGFATSIVQYASQILLQALLAPIVLRVAGRETLGAFAAIVQVLSLLGLVDIAGSWSLERFLAQAMGKDPSGASFREVFTTARTIFLLTNTLFALLVVLLSLFIGRIFHLSPEVAWQARWALRAIAIWAIVRTPLAAYANALVAMQDLAVVNMIGTLIGVSRAIAAVALALAGGGLFGLMLAGTIAEAGGLILCRVRFKKLSPNLMPGWGMPDRALMREMVGFGGHAMFMNVGNILIARSGNMLAGLTNGAAVASTFYTSQTPGMMGYDMIQRFSDSATPGINELFGQGDMVRVRTTMMRMMRMMLALALPLAVGVLLFNRDLVVAWVGEAQYAGRLLTICLAIYCATFAVQRIAIIHCFVLGWMKLLSATAFLQGAVYFGLALWLGRRLGLGGITLSLVVVIIPQNIILWIKLGRQFNLNPLGFISKYLLQSIFPLGSAAGLAWLVHGHIIVRRHHFQGLLAEMLTFLVVYCVVAYFVLLERLDREDVNRYLRAALNRGRFVQSLLRRGMMVA
jgi:O-antigen/teichoic acid export membrane protein